MLLSFAYQMRTKPSNRDQRSAGYCTDGLIEQQVLTLSQDVKPKNRLQHQRKVPLTRMV
jgi:hypothetical protein